MPVIELDGHVMCESVDCCEYLDEVYNSSQLISKDHARDKRIIERFSEVIEEKNSKTQARLRFLVV